MHIVVAAISILFLAFRLYLRIRRAHGIASTLVDTVADAPLAVRRYKFRRKANLHPVEMIDDPAFAIAALAAAHVEMELMPGQDHWDRLKIQLARALDVSGADAEELMVVGRWLVAECGTVDAAVARLSRKLYRMAGPNRAGALFDLLKAIVTAHCASPNGRQKDAVKDIARLMKTR